MRDTPKTHQICTIVPPTKTGRTLRIREAATPEKDVAEPFRLLRVTKQVIKRLSSWTDLPPSTASLRETAPGPAA
jgi:hypothetical protein